MSNPFSVFWVKLYLITPSDVIIEGFGIEYSGVNFWIYYKKKENHFSDSLFVKYQYIGSSTK